jgi:hypothetical protein
MPRSTNTATDAKMIAEVTTNATAALARPTATGAAIPATHLTTVALLIAAVPQTAANAMTADRANNRSGRARPGRPATSTLTANNVSWNPRRNQHPC